MNAVVQYQERNQLTAADVRAHVNLIQQVMEAVMIGPNKDHPEGIHYGKIPGTPKPTLYKAGAEKILETFKIAPSYIIEDLGAKGFSRYRVRCIGTHYVSGQVLGEGMGACSSLEEKYKWRKAASNAEYDNTPENERRIKYGYNKAERREYEIKQVRTEAADLDNTILKMACKRALVHMAITVTAASDIFTQDVEDLPPEMQLEAEEAQPPVEGPRSKSAAPAVPPSQPAPPSGKADGAAPDPKDSPLSEGAKKTMRAQMARVARTEADITAAGFPSVDAMPFSKLNDCMDWLKKNPAC